MSQHLAVLRSAGLLSVRREGTFTYYALRDFAVLGIADLAARLAEEASLPPSPIAAVKGCACPACRAEAEGHGG